LSDRPVTPARTAARHAWVPASFAVPPTGSGPLSGRTVAVKDMIAIEGHVPSFGHPRWRETHQPATSTAPLVRALLDAGARVAGLAKLDQLAFSLVGNVGEGEPPPNPRYPDRFTGGSSSGSASAVASGLVDIGMGTDTAGSVRVPAAACGLYGFRPTHGLIDATGVIPLAPPFDVPGVLAREPGLLADVIGVLARLMDSRVTEIRVARDLLPEVDEETAGAVTATAAAIGAATGCDVVECEFRPFLTRDASGMFNRLLSREVWAAHGAWIGANGSFLAAEVRDHLARAERMSAATAAERRSDAGALVRYRHRYADFTPPGTVTVLPVLSGLPPRRDSTPAELHAFRASAFRLAAPGSLTGSPQVVVPVTHPVSGRCVGVGLLGTPGSDAALLTLAGAG
jgi:amidase